MTIIDVWIPDEAREAGPVGWLVWDGEQPPDRIRARVRGRRGGDGRMGEYALTDVAPPEGDGLVYARSRGPAGGTAATLVPRFGPDGAERPRPPAG